EPDEFLGRGWHQPLDENHDNYRNGYRPRKINLFVFGLGEVELRVPSRPERGFRIAMVAGTQAPGPGSRGFSGGPVDTRPGPDEKHLGQKYDSEQVSRIVARATTELEAWRQARCTASAISFSTWMGLTSGYESTVT